MSTPATNYNDEMAPFWAFVANVQKQGPSHPWFQRRARAVAARAEAAEAAKAADAQSEPMANPWKLRRDKGQGLGPRGGMRRRQQQQQQQQQQQSAEAAVLPAGIRELVPQNEKVEVKEVLFEMPPSENEKVDSAVETPRSGPGARRGAGRGGRGGRGQGLGRAHRLAAANREINAAQTQIPVESDSEKTVSGDEGRKGPGARRGGPGRGRGLGLNGPRGAGRAANRLAREQIAVAPEAAAAVSGPQAGMRGPGFGMRGMRGAGMGRARGVGMARNLAMHGAGSQDAHIEHGPHHGPGAHGAGPRGRRMGAGRGCGQGLGRGRGAAAGGRNLNQGPNAVQQNGPNARRQSQGPAGPRARSLSKGPNANRARIPSKSDDETPRFGPRMRRFRPLGPNKRNARKGPFTPAIDIFDLKEAFVIHASLPGAKKDDIDVNWDSEKSELNIAGHVDKPGDEEFLKRMAMNERKTGKFNRKVQMPPKASIDVEAISAKMEDGILKIEVPKMDAGFVEVKKVDIN